MIVFEVVLVGLHTGPGMLHIRATKKTLAPTLLQLEGDSLKLAGNILSR